MEIANAERLADPTAGWPMHAARTVKDLVLSPGHCLCKQSKYKRLALSKAHETLLELLGETANAQASSTTRASSVELEVVAQSPSRPLASPPAPAAAASASDLSKQVRKMRKGGTMERLQRNTSNGFDAAMRRMNLIYAARVSDAGVSLSFEDQINFWYAQYGMRRGLMDDLHTLRIWRNASDHHDAERWRRDGPSSESAAAEVLARVEAAIKALE